MDPTTPVLVGTGQLTHRGPEPRRALDLLADAAELALADAGGRLTAAVDAVWVVNVLSDPHPALASALAKRLVLDVPDRAVTTIGGNSPQALVSSACELIRSGERRAVLIAGAEAGASARHPDRVDGPVFDGRADRVLGDSRMGVGSHELAVGLGPPSALYPLFESAIAARSERDPTDQRRWLGRFCSPMAAIAADNDLAWFPMAYTADDIAEVTADNRLVAQPYTKRMNSVLAVDQAAALIVTSAEVARNAGVDRSGWVFPWSSASCNDVFLPSQRPRLDRSEGLAAAGRAALTAAGVGIDDIGAIDLYSCFPCAIQMGAEALGLPLHDPARLTLTGSMPYFGGPGNNYATHGIAHVAAAIRAGRTTLGLATGLGWYVTKHAVGVYGANPPPRGWRYDACTEEQRVIDDRALPVATDPAGPAQVEAMTVLHDRTGHVTRAPVFARLRSGERVAADAAPGLAADLVGVSLVGSTIFVRTVEGVPSYELIDPGTR
jgi:acetyl-CoA C-acetyltransferase